MFSFIKHNKNTDNKQNSSNDLPQAEQSNHVTTTEGKLAKKLNIPIRFIGVGESIDNLRPFNGKEFVSALLSRDNS